MNWILVAGHLGSDAEERFTPSGQRVVNLRVAVNSRRRGEETTTWYRITIWGDRFDKMLPYLKKGSAIIVGGELHKPEIYTDREGKPQVSLEITAETLRFSPFGRTGERQQTTPETASAFVQPAPELETAKAGAAMDDNLPF